MMKNTDLLYNFACAIFFLLAIVVLWHSLAPRDYHVLSEYGRKIWAMAGLSLYIVIILERRRRNQNGQGQA